jgi:hypothetical protein
MTDVFDAMDALVAVFDGIDGLTADLGPVDNIVAAPAAVLVEAADGEFLNYLITTDGEVDAQLTVTVMVQATTLSAAKELLRPYMADGGTASVRALVAADPTLGSVVTDAVITSASNLGRYVIGDTERRYFGVTFNVAVML